MNWDWDKLQEQKQRQGGTRPGGGGGGIPPEFEEMADKFKDFKGFNFPTGKVLVVIALGLWLLSGIYIVQPDEAGVVKRFGAYDRTTQPGPHYALPFPIESVMTPKVTQIRRVEFGFRSLNRDRNRTFEQGQNRDVPKESLMLTGDENIVDVQFIVQYLIKDAENFLFNVSAQEDTIRNAAEAAMREIIGKSNIDSALTTGKLKISNETKDLMQEILDRYKAGLSVVAVQLQNVHPPAEVIDAFKDVASAREDKSRFINEAEAYRNDILPKTRGQAAAMVNEAEAYKASKIKQSQGEAARFTALLKEYKKAPDVTRKRLYLETMEKVLSNPELEKVILSDDALKKSVPYLPLNQLPAAGKK
ncbi:MAG: FtsH protease activity modulator HflK [Desulfovibrio sp.]